MSELGFRGYYFLNAECSQQTVLRAGANTSWSLPWAETRPGTPHRSTEVAGENAVGRSPWEPVPGCCSQPTAGAGQGGKDRKDSRKQGSEKDLGKPGLGPVSQQRGPRLLMILCPPGHPNPPHCWLLGQAGHRTEHAPSLRPALQAYNPGTKT